MGEGTGSEGDAWARIGRGWAETIADALIRTNRSYDPAMGLARG